MRGLRHDSARHPAIGLAFLLGMLTLAVPARAQVAGAGVLGAIHETGRARVIVALRAPAVSASSVTYSKSVRAIGDGVMLGLTEAEFVITHRWDNIAALAGDVTAAGLVALLQSPEVLRVDLDVRGRMALSESSNMIRAGELNARGLTGAGITVAILDTGIDGTHPDLSDDLVDEACFCENADGSGCCPGGGTSAFGPGSARDEQGHGTHVTGIVTGRGGVAPRGVAPDAKIVAVRVLDAAGVASGTTQVISGLDWVMQNHPEVRVINFSLGFETLFSGPCDSAAAFATAFAQAIGALKARGSMVFASSLNTASATQIGLPACISSAVAVGAVYDGNVGSISFGCSDATTARDQITCFSNSNDQVDVLAPGAAITSTGLGGGMATFIGTSQAAPHAAAAAALLLQAKPGLTPDQILNALKATGAVITDPRNGLSFPRLDVLAALDATP
jgi:subtilisin family serine protease